MATKPRVTSSERRWSRQRRHQRFLSRVSLFIEWQEGPLWQRADAVTVVVSASGCMVVSSSALPLGEHVLLTNPESGRSSEAQVVWGSREAWHFGLELIEPDLSFWGVQFWTPIAPGAHALYSKGWGN
jgi:PilZ domain